MRIVFAGIIGRYPWGGVSWCSLMYLLGLRKLGHDVFYLEDTLECNYDPEKNTIAEDPAYALTYIQDTLQPFGLGDAWCYVDYLGRHHGRTQEALAKICHEADLFIVLSGGCWIWRDHYLRIPTKIFIDSDPAFTQMAIARAQEVAATDEKKRWYVDFFRTYDALFTFGSNIGTAHCDVPTAGLTWRHTWQPVCPDLWHPGAMALPRRDVWTTLMTWQIKSFADIGGNKDTEFLKVVDHANLCRAQGIEIELAVNGPKDLLRDKGWRCIDAMAVSGDPWRYHQYIHSSRAEFSVAKHTYVATNSGWFSDRTICYLASGHPAVVQDTGFVRSLPTGHGLLSWQTPGEALEAMQEVEADYLRHAKQARVIAEEHFRDDVVLGKLLSELP